MSKSKDKLFRENIEYRCYRILHFAKKHGWQLIKNNSIELIFENMDGINMMIDYTKLEIKTNLFHPIWGYTSLTRKGDFTQKIIESIFINPRMHMPRKIKSEYIKC